MRRLFTSIIVGTFAVLATTLAAGPAAAQEVEPVGSSTVSVRPAVAQQFAAQQVAVDALDGATRTVVDGQVTLEFPVVGDPSDGTVELDGTLQLSSASATLTLSELIVDSTAGIVTASDGNGRLDVFTVVTAEDGTTTLAFTTTSAFGLNVTFGTTFASGEEFGTAVTTIDTPPAA